MELSGFGQQEGRLTPDPNGNSCVHHSNASLFTCCAGAAGSSCPSATPGLHTVNEVNEEKEGPYGFVCVCTQASRSVCMCVWVCVCARVFKSVRGPGSAETAAI